MHGQFSTVFVSTGRCPRCVLLCILTKASQKVSWTEGVGIALIFLLKGNKKWGLSQHLRTIKAAQARLSLEGRGFKRPKYSKFSILTCSVFQNCSHLTFTPNFKGLKSFLNSEVTPLVFFFLEESLWCSAPRSNVSGERKKAPCFPLVCLPAWLTASVHRFGSEDRGEKTRSAAPGRCGCKGLLSGHCHNTFK